MSEENKKYFNLKVKKEKDKAIIEAEVPAEIFEKHKMEVIREFQKEFEKEGFRKGHVPLEMVEAEVGDEKIMSEAVNRALNDAYPEIVREEGLKVMLSPKVSLTKFAPGNPLGFKAEVAIVPEFKLPKYKSIGKEITENSSKEKVEVKDEEVNQIIGQILRMHAENEKKEEGEEKESKTPELTDEFVKTLGDFKSADDFKNKVRENLKHEKEMAKIREAREKIAEELVKQTNLEIPEDVIENELHSVRHRLEHDLEHQSLAMDEYMKKMNMTEEEFFKEQREHIERQLKTKIILERIAEEEDVVPDEKMVELQAQMLEKRYADIDSENLKNYVRMMLKNEKVLKLLEGGESPPGK